MDNSSKSGTVPDVPGQLACMGYSPYSGTIPTQSGWDSWTSTSDQG